MHRFALKGFVLAGLVSLTPALALADGEQQVNRGERQEQKADRTEGAAETAAANGHPHKAARLRRKAAHERHNANKNVRQGERREAHGE